MFVSRASVIRRKPIILNVKLRGKSFVLVLYVYPVIVPYSVEEMCKVNHQTQEEVFRTVHKSHLFPTVWLVIEGLPIRVRCFTRLTLKLDS